MICVLVPFPDNLGSHGRENSWPAVIRLRPAGDGRPGIGDHMILMETCHLDAIDQYKT